MAAEAILLDPEFEGLLREAAAQPGSCLLKVPRPKTLKGLFERDEPISEHAAELSNLERHLVQVYRCEIAWLLRQACLIKLMEGARSRLWVCRYKTVEQEYERLSIPELRERVANVGQEGPQSPDSTIDLLEMCATDPLEESPTVAELASLSCRLEPTDDARIFAAMYMAQNGAPRASMRLLMEILRRPTTERLELSARSNLGSAYGIIGDLPSAHRCYSWVCAKDQACVGQWMSRLYFGIQLGLDQDVLESARTLDRSLRHGHPAVEEFVRAHICLRGESRWQPTRESYHTLKRVASHFGLVAGRIADVFA